MLANHAPAANDSPQGDSDYDIILAALMDSARGRSFLQEYALRHRIADTATLLTAIGRIEGLLTSRSLEPAGPNDDAAPSDAVAPSEAVAELVVDPAVIEPQAAGPDAIESEPEVAEIDAAEIEPVPIGIAATAIASVAAVTPQPMPPEVAALDGTALQVLAIEFLGPNLRGPEPVVPARKEIPARAKQHVPFAEIRALSDIEKIAVFT